MRSFNAALIIVVVFLTTTNSGLSQSVVWDTVGTGIVQLAVSNHGSMGLNGIGGANMDFTSSGLDCNPSADVYLRSGGLFIIQKIDSAAGIFEWSSGLNQIDASNSYSFKPDPTGPPSSHFVGPVGSDAFFSGRFLNWDSTIGIEQTYFAPNSGSANDNFIIVRSDIYPLDGNPHPNLLIGDVIDWNVPSDSINMNTAGITGVGLPFNSVVYLQGTDTTASTSCQSNAMRFSNSIFLGMYTNAQFNIDNCVNDLELHGTFASDNTVNNSATGGSPNGVLDSALTWNWSSALIGEFLISADTAVDQRINKTVVFDYTLGAGDTLTFYTALMAVRNGDRNDIELTTERAYRWYGDNLRCGNLSVCFATGNIDCVGGLDIADLTLLIDHLFITFVPLPCPWEADIDGDCVVSTDELFTILSCLQGDPSLCNWNTPTCCFQEKPIICGDVNDDGIPDVDDFQPLMDHLLGGLAPACQFCAELDGRKGLTVGDLVRLVESLFISFHAECDTSQSYSYSLSIADTIFVPRMLDVPENFQSVELPIFANVFNALDGAQIPIRALGPGSGNLFDLDSIRVNGLSASRTNVAVDTSQIIYGGLGTDKSPLAIMDFSRAQQGVGSVIPELVGSLLNLPFAIYHRDSNDLVIPVVKSYDADPCCLGNGGNVDCDQNNTVDIADLTMLIDHLFINFPSLCCRSEANVDLDTDVEVDIADLTALIDHLFISFAPIQSCQVPYLDD